MQKSLKKFMEEPTVNELVEMIDTGRIDLNPIYQRDYKWNDDNREALLESWFKGYPINAAMLIKKEYTQGKYNVMDGKQRITTVYKFVKGILYKKGTKTILLKLNIGNGVMKTFHELDKKTQKFLLEQKPIPLIIYDSDDQPERINTMMQRKYFNQCQHHTALLAAEKHNANSANHLSQKLSDALECDKNNVKKILETMMKDKSNYITLLLNYAYILDDNIEHGLKPFTGLNDENDTLKSLDQYEDDNEHPVNTFTIQNMMKGIKKIYDDVKNFNKITCWVPLVALIHISMHNTNVDMSDIYNEVPSSGTGKCNARIKDIFTTILDNYKKKKLNIPAMNYENMKAK
jgi:hypothetical protein